MSPLADQRLFTVAEANASLPALRPLLEQLRDLVADAQRRHAEVEQLQEMYPRANGHRMELEGQVRRGKALLAAAAADIQKLIDQAQALGCEVKDPSTGLIDFRGLRDGEVVYLCWRLGEGDIAYWHTLQGGFAGRRPL